MSKTFFEFVRAADKFLKEWDGERRASHLDTHVEAMTSSQPPKALGVIIASLPENTEGVEAFRAAYAKFREKYSAQIDLAQAINLLELCEPQMRHFVRENRKMNPDAPTTITYTIRQFIERNTDTLDSVRIYRQLIDLYEKALQKALEGVDPTKTKAKIEEGRKLLGLEMKA
jgi:hypothetical protein